MSLNKLQFTKDWKSASDFPTYEGSEEQVRADMQLLHDETRDFLNDQLIPGVEKSFATKQELNDVVVGISPDLTATEAVLSEM